MDKLKSYFLATALAGVLYLGATQISFGQDLIVDGPFSSFTSPAGGELTTTAAGGYTGVTLSAWSSGGYIFVFPSGNEGDGPDVASSFGTNFSLWGSNNGGLTTLTAPPDGGDVVAADGAYRVGPLSQVVSGLTSGQTYAVSFEWAGAQQSGFNGATTESWTVSLGAPGLTGVASASIPGALTTPVVDDNSHSATPWMSQTFDFTATGASETLYFLATGTPNGVPPFSLLGDVTMTAVPVPEPKASAGWTLLFVMLTMAGNWVRHRYQNKSAASA